MAHKPGGGRKPGGGPYTAADIAQCGRRLGIDPIFEAHLLWVAEEALAAPLSEGWAEHRDSSTGAPFYLYTSVDGRCWCLPAVLKVQTDSICSLLADRCRDFPQQC